MIGVNFIADITGEGSLSEIARTTLDSLWLHGVEIDYTEVLYPYDLYRAGVDIPARFRNLPPGQHRFDVNLLCYNVHVFDIMPPERLHALTRGKYTIASWVWEMPTVPPAWIPHFSRVNQIWVPSTFTQNIMQAVTNTPIHAVPHAVHIPTSPIVRRVDFGLPEDRFIFLFTFSAGSGDGRKNPWGVIEAFRQAFGLPDKDGPLLVMKSQHSSAFPELMGALKLALDEVGGLLIEDTYSRQGMNDLLSCVDAYVSLHRAEGFGLGMAEAMSVGKPVIATAYSGNMDYMTPENSYLVDYVLRPVTAEDHRYRPDLVSIYALGLIWAEADIDQAAAYMRHIYENQEEARTRGQRSREHIQTHFGLEAVGKIMVGHLQDTLHSLKS
jgi:glycosyltransferase involved in cell wall biosynthesis